MKRAAAGLLVLAAACGRFTPPAQTLARYEGASMGSSWHASVVHESGVVAPAPAELQSILDEVDRLMSTWKKESELSRFNAWVPAGAEDAFPVSPWTAAAVAEALAAAELSGGAFDPTVLPLVELWGFGASGERVGEPAAAEINAALASIGWQRVGVREGALWKEDAKLGLDLSGSAPGFAADLISQHLRERGFPDHLVEVGGEVLVHGLAPGGRPWRVGIEQPVDGAEQGELLNVAIEVRDAAVATSGDYRKFRISADGRRLSHEIDPRTGRPITNFLASVTVIAPACGLGDALATACMILGPEEALALAERLPDVEAYLLLREASGFRALRTSGFPAPAK
jgi:thiamine biosynthesis lipoprotein